MTSDTSLQTSDFDERMMRRALELAARGVGQVSPSPLVGCVIAADGGEVVGEGFYLYEGVKHAETLALEQAAGRARGATAYVSLEPHAHTGRTPPCTTALIQAGVRRVVAPVEDPNPLVSGRGFADLRAAGVRIETGLLAREAERLNEAYIHFHRAGRPFVHLKLGVSLDGRIATRTGDTRWITGAESRARAHQLRHLYDAILVGAGTVKADDPVLTDRSGLARRRPLARVVLDKHFTLDARSQLARTARAAPVILFTDEKAFEGTRAAGERRAELEACGVEVVPVRDGGYDLRAALEELKRRDLQSVLVEGGSAVAGAFRDAGLVDKLTFFVAPLVIGGRDATPAVGGLGAATLAEAPRLRELEIIPRGVDVEVTGYPERTEVRG